MLRYKIITTDVLTIVHLLVEPITPPFYSCVSPSAAVNTISDMTLNSASSISAGSQHMAEKEEAKQGGR